jgi:CheY-like chemotaxis protein
MAIAADEELVRASNAEMLLDIGYELVEANSGEQALALLNSGLKPDFVVTDHLMPGVSGTALARLVRFVCPQFGCWWYRDMPRRRACLPIYPAASNLFVAATSRPQLRIYAGQLNRCRASRAPRSVGIGRNRPAFDECDASISHAAMAFALLSSQTATVPRALCLAE